MNKKIIFALPTVAFALMLAVSFTMFSDYFVFYQNSDAMYPTILPGDLLLIQQIPIEEVKEDDIIAFYTHAQGVEVLVRRTVLISDDHKGNLGIDTKGDEQDHPDPWTVYSGEFIGKVVEINPQSGFLVSDGFRYVMAAGLVGSAILFAREFVPKKGMEVEQLKCLRCNYQWYPRVINGETKIPSTCPNKKCRSPYWQTPRKNE